ncbi:MAG: DUF58 domain-containing protein [Planctomycetes bacterium]|jgi:uncharacterized protein (DUF58 family)|nr:DUF58 domain-containing protein [Planctomycetota bacterium]HPY75866.1 DUF58 domain-containing protein [Planctomycetota bacterium]HQB01447.1 DUF58 domain-containing protein [Planctomycetota bacterium]
MILSQDLAKKIRYIQIYTNKAVNDILAGEYQSVFKGSGMEFDEVREYIPGDEIRTIDWNVTARMNKPYVKRYREERELTLMLVVDISASGIFSTTQQSKNEYIAQLSALLAFTATKNNDKVGLILFSDKVHKYIPPQKGTTHVLKIIREVLTHRPPVPQKTTKTWWKKILFTLLPWIQRDTIQPLQTDIACALDYLAHIQKRRAVVFLISDFQSMEYETAIRTTAKRHDLIAIPITDPREKELPNVGILTLQDAETGQQITIDTSSSQVRTQYKLQQQQKQQELQHQWNTYQIDHIDLQTDQEPTNSIIHFFQNRRMRNAMI